MPKIRHVKSVQSRKMQEMLFELKFIKGVEEKDIYYHRDRYRDFWQLWCNLKGIYSFEDLSQEDVGKRAMKSLRYTSNNFYGDKEFVARMEDLRKQRDMNVLPIDRTNEVVFSEVVEDVIFDESNREICRTKTQEIVTKKVERIEFASNLTVSAIRNMEESQKLADEWFKDYKEAIDARNEGREYRGKYDFKHMELAAKFKVMALNMADDFEKIILNGTSADINAARSKMNAIMKFSEMMDQVKKLEMQPLYVMNVMHEAGFNRQKELQGAVANDKMMIEHGNIIMEKEDKTVVDRQKMRDKLKELGYNGIQAIMSDELRAVGAQQAEIEEEIANPKIIEEEVVDDFDRSE